MTENETKIRCLRLSITKLRQTKKSTHKGANSEIFSKIDLKAARNVSKTTYVVGWETKDVDISLLHEESKITNTEYKKRLKCLIPFLVQSSTTLRSSLVAIVAPVIEGYRIDQEKGWNLNPGTATTDLEKQLLETVAYHCHSNFSFPKRILPLDLNALLLFLFHFIAFDSLLLCVHMFIKRWNSKAK